MSEKDKKEVKKQPRKNKKMEESIKKFMAINNQEEINKLIGKKDPKRILVINGSNRIKDESVIALLLKYENVQYKCSQKGCEVDGIWLNKAIPLLLVRKNKKQNDLRPTNLCLKCPNCYYQENIGTTLISKLEANKFPKCDSCGYSLAGLPDNFKNLKLCKICYTKISPKINDYASASILYKSNCSDGENGSDDEEAFKLYMKQSQYDGDVNDTGSNIGGYNASRNFTFTSDTNNKKKIDNKKNTMSSNKDLGLDLNLDIDLTEFNL